MRKIKAKWQILLNKVWRAKKSKRNSLNWLAEEAQKTQCKMKKTNFLRRGIAESYYPSLRSFFMVLPFPFFFYAISQSSAIANWFHHGSFRIWWTNPLDANGNGYSDLIAIQAGIGIIIFALVIFIAESVRDDDAKDRSRVLLKESFLFPLTVVEILTLFTFIWGSANFWSVIPVFLIGIFTVFSLSRIILVLINKHKFAIRRSELLKDRLGRSFGLAIKERLANNILISKLEKPEMKLKFSPYFGRDSGDFYDVQASKFGLIADIDVHILAKIGDYVEVQAARNGFAFSGDRRPDVRASLASEIPALETVQQNLNVNTKRYLVKKFHDMVSAESRVLLRIDRSLLKGAVDIEVLHSLVKSAFTIERRDNFAEEMRIEISSVRDQLLSAISGRQPGKVKELTSLYQDLGDVSLDLITQCGGGYSAESARLERFTLFSGWDQVKWLSSDIYDFYRASIRSGDSDFVRDITYLPVSIAIRAIGKDEHYLYQEFVDFAKYTYALALKEKDEDLREVLVDRSWRYLKEMSMIYLETQLRDRDLDEERASSLKDFAIYLFVVFQDLLKQSFDSRDIASFKIFLREANKLFEDMELESQLSTTRYWRHRLRTIDPSDSESIEIHRLLEARDFREVAQDGIENAKQQMIYGLASWILDQYVKECENESLKECYRLIQELLPENIEDFTALFLAVHSYEVESFWGWDRWEMRVDEGVYTIQIMEKLERLFAVKCLSYLVNETTISIERITLPYDRELASLAKGNRDLLPTIESFKSDPDRWKFLLSDRMFASVDLLLHLLDKAEKMQGEDELRKIRLQVLSPTRIHEFKEGFNKGFDETCTLRGIFSHCGRMIRDETVSSFGDDARFGINTVADKGAFVDESPVIYYEWGRDYGRNFALSEDAFLVEQMVSASANLEVSGQEFDERLSEVASANDLLILGVNVAFWDYFQGIEKFRPKWSIGQDDLGLVNLDGYYDVEGVLIPVFEVYNPKFEKQILILKKSKLGYFRQVSPLNSGEDQSLVENGFYKDVTAFSSDELLMKRFLENPPEWLRSKGDGDEQRLYLQTRVRLQLFERIKFDSQDFEGFRILIPE